MVHFAFRLYQKDVHSVRNHRHILVHGTGIPARLQHAHSVGRNEGHAVNRPVKRYAELAVSDGCAEIVTCRNAVDARKHIADMQSLRQVEVALHALAEAERLVYVI